MADERGFAIDWEATRRRADEQQRQFRYDADEDLYVNDVTGERRASVGIPFAYADRSTDVYGPIAGVLNAIPNALIGRGALDAAAANRRLEEDLRGVGELVVGPEDLINTGRRVLAGNGDWLDYGMLGLSVLPLPGGVRRGLGRLGRRAAGTRFGRAMLDTNGTVYEPEDVTEIVQAMYDSGASRAEVDAYMGALGTAYSDPAEATRSFAIRDAQAALAARPAYSVREQGPALRVEREGLAREANPALAEGDIADLRVRMADPEQNAALRLANEEAIARTGQPLDLTSLPQTSLRRQGGIARMFDAATEGSPDYKGVLFEQYGLQMPEVVEQARAQNYDQLTEAAYRQLAQEAQQQFDRLPVGMNYHYGELEYPTPSAMFRDALGRGELNVFRGGDPHPFLSDIDPATRLTGNEQFRAVHDYIGHGASGSTFRPGGEEIAYATHAQTLSPLAQMALLSETRGQNSWVNYSPANVDLIAQMEDVRGRLAGASGAEADALRRQLRDLGGQFQYAAQEPVLLPPEYLAVGSEGGVPEWARGLIVPRAPTSAAGVHYGRVEGLTQTDPSFYGRGHQGAEYKTVRREGLPNRTYFYSQGADGSPVSVEEPVAQRGARFVYDADLQNLYDVNVDPERIVALANLYRGEGSAIPDIERLVRQYGYSGYLSDYGRQRAAAMFEPVNVRQR